MMEVIYINCKQPSALWHKFQLFFLTDPTASDLVALHNQLSLLQWESQEQKREILDLRKGIKAFQENEAVLIQTIQQQEGIIEDLRSGVEAVNSGVVNKLEQKVVKLEGKLQESFASLRQYWQVVRAKDLSILNLQREITHLDGRKQLLKRELKVAKQVMRYHQCLPAFDHQLDSNTAAPSSVPQLTIKRSKVRPLSRLNLKNPLLPFTEEDFAIA